MRPEGRKFVELVSQQYVICEPIYEFGSYLVEGQEELANLRSFFSNKKYVGCDSRAGNGVDLVMDVENINLSSETAGTIICVDTLEHVKNPIRAVEQMHRVLKDGGLLILVSVMCFPIHNYPSDYWRFTPECFKMMLKMFKSVEVKISGDPRFPIGVYAVAVK